MAQNDIFLFYKWESLDHENFIVTDSIQPHYIWQKRKIIWTKLESNSGPMALQAADLSIAPFPLGANVIAIISK